MKPQTSRAKIVVVINNRILGASSLCTWYSNESRILFGIISRPSTIVFVLLLKFADFRTFFAGICGLY